MPAFARELDRLPPQLLGNGAIGVQFLNDFVRQHRVLGEFVHQ